MKQVNAAYLAGDKDTLRRILADLENSPDAVQGSGVGADLIRVLRQLKQVRNRIAAIDLEIANLSESDLAKLKAKADAAAAEGRDLLAEMEATVQGSVNVARERFEKKSDAEASRRVTWIPVTHLFGFELPHLPTKQHRP